MRRLGVVALVLTLSVLRAPPAHAHAFLDHADPRVGSSVAPSPPAVTLLFTEPVEEAFSRVDLLDPSGNRVDTPAVEHPEPATLRVPLPPLPPGEYTVRWAVVSVDTHPTQGSFTFSVKAR